jgi:hypothetical protein
MRLRNAYICKVQQDGAVLADRVEHHRSARFGDHLAHDVDALRFQTLQVRKRGELRVAARRNRLGGICFGFGVRQCLARIVAGRSLLYPSAARAHRHRGPPAFLICLEDPDDGRSAKAGLQRGVVHGQARQAQLDGAKPARVEFRNRDLSSSLREHFIVVKKVARRLPFLRIVIKLFRKQLNILDD